MSRRLRSLALLLPLLSILAACYEVAPDSGRSATPAPRVPNPRPANTLVGYGSAIVGVLIRNAGLRFQAGSADSSGRLGKSGARDGLKLQCDDTTDTQAAVRAINTDETSACLRNRVDTLQIIVGYDALAIVGDAPVQGCISASELAYVYTRETANLHWNDVRAGLQADLVRVRRKPAHW